jgi:hypothetical protein
MANKLKRPLFKVGQVVMLDTEFYQTGENSAERYQRIVRVFPWKSCKAHPFGYKFLNGDECNEKYIRPLTTKEHGGQ